MLSQFLLPSGLSLRTTQSVMYLNVYFASCVGTNAIGSHQCLHKSVFASVPTHQHQEDIASLPSHRCNRWHGRGDSTPGIFLANCGRCRLTVVACLRGTLQHRTVAAWTRGR